MSSATENPRQEKAVILMESGVKPVDVGPNQWAVESESGLGTTYVVEKDEGMWLCTCRDFEFRGGECKHILLVKLSQEQVKKTCETCKRVSNLASPWPWCDREKAHVDRNRSACDAYRHKLSKAEEVKSQIEK
jgi:hypothetical protein